jgi:hypothetical protein
MNILPNELIRLDDKLQRIGSIPRLNAVGAIAGQILREQDYDKFIVTHKDVVSDALREAGILNEASSLFYLGKILSIDALFAEIDSEEQTFRRFVIVEDKLFRNPEARREVLGQILEYAKALRETDVERLSELLSNEHRAWLDANDDLITQAFHNANFLLLVCGDRIQPRLIEYVKHLKKQLDPLIAADVALLSLAIFSDGAQHILIPYVVALITAEQGIAIKVIVQNIEGDNLSASIALQEEHSLQKRRGEKIEIEALTEAIRKTGGTKAVEVAQTLFNYAQELGAEVKPGEASASVRLKDPNSGKYSTLFVVTRNATFYIGFLKRWTLNAGVDPEIARIYERRLTDILGRSPVMIATGGASAIPLTELGKHLEPVLNEIRLATKALRHEDT